MRFKISRYIYVFSVCLILFSCKDEAVEEQNDEFISRVYEYVYAPGQHGQKAKLADTLNFIGNSEEKFGFVYLGGFGGYIVAGFNHNVINHDGFDFQVYALGGAVPEPAIVYVMRDENGDGEPNDIWYELKGNQFDNSKRNYWVRYYKALNDTSNVLWLDSEGSRGELVPGYGASNSATWWWNCTTADSITFHGTRLPDAYDNQSTETTQLWTVPQDRFVWGYAENNFGTDFDNQSKANKMDISNAVDSLGNPVSLPDIRFIKLQTGVFQQAGWTNEVSSELKGAKELK